MRHNKSERGQALILLMLVMTVVFVIGAIVVDFGLWFSERRGAQKDAELSALAAAQPLLALMSTTDPGADALKTQANDRAAEYVQRNGVNDLVNNAHFPLLSDNAEWTGCWADDGDTTNTIDSYPLDVEHPSRSFFAGIFGIGSPINLGAHARACVGSIVAMKGIMPVGIPINQPNFEDWSRELCWGPDDPADPDNLPEPEFGVRCDLSVFDKASGEASWLDLDHPGDPPVPPSDECHRQGGGGSELYTEIESGGANTICRIAPLGFEADDCLDTMQWCVKSKTGAAANPIMGAFNELFCPGTDAAVYCRSADGEGDCDITGDGIDDFAGTVELVSGTIGTDSAFFREICDSPRLVTIIIVDNFDATGNDFMPIRAFAAFFVEACTRSDDTQTVIEEFPKCDPNGQIGQYMFTGRFVNILGEGAVGAPNDWSPKRIVLDE